MTATLRLLRLIVKHSDEVQEVVESRLGSSPTSPWTAIVPQLFSRLNHRELYVRKRVAELLSRIGVDSPHLIIFPAVVGSHTGASTIKEMPTTSKLSQTTPVVNNMTTFELFGIKAVLKCQIIFFVLSHFNYAVISCLDRTHNYEYLLIICITFLHNDRQYY